MRGTRILVVDDHVDTARGMARLLRLIGNDVQVAHDGPDALEIGRTFRPDFVLLDIGGFPGMDGYEVATRGSEPTSVARGPSSSASPATARTRTGAAPAPRASTITWSNPSTWIRC